MSKFLLLPNNVTNFNLFFLLFFIIFQQLTHFVMLKELRHCRNIEDLCCSETVKHKAKEYVKKYMAAKGPIYRPEANEEICKDKEKCSPNS